MKLHLRSSLRESRKAVTRNFRLVNNLKYTEEFAQYQVEMPLSNLLCRKETPVVNSISENKKLLRG